MIFNAYATKSPDTGGEITITFEPGESYKQTRVYDCNGRDTLENAPYQVRYGVSLAGEDWTYLGDWEPGSVLQDVPGIECGGRYFAYTA